MGSNTYVDEKQFTIDLYDYIGVGYVLLAVGLSLIYSFHLDFSLLLRWDYDFKFLRLAVMFVLLNIAWMAILVRKNGKCKESIFGLSWRQQVRQKYLRPIIIFRLIKVLIWLKIILFIYCNIKQAIPFINHRLFDKELLGLDQFLAFGVNPNILAVKLFGAPFISPLFDKFYVLWYFIKPLILVYFAISPSKALHNRFFTTYFLMWIIGGLLALAFPSLGPIYVHPEWFESVCKPYANMFQVRLGTHYLLALSNPTKYKYFIYEGIAAFPSLHVGIIAVFAFFVNERSKVLGLLLFIYLAIIQIGSILLGWHYMIDGVFAIALAFLLYALLTKRKPTLLHIKMEIASINEHIDGKPESGG